MIDHYQNMLKKLKINSPGLFIGVYKTIDFICS